jgi:hypothetical protein
MCLRDLALVVVLVLGADAVTLGASQETTHVKGVAPLRNAQQDFDMPRLVADIRTALDVVPGADRAFVAAQDVDVIEDAEAYAVYKTVLPIKFSSGDKELTHVTLLQETRAGRMDCPFDEGRQPDGGPSWRTTERRTPQSGKFRLAAISACRIRL